MYQCKPILYLLIFIRAQLVLSFSLPLGCSFYMYDNCWFCKTDKGGGCLSVRPHRCSPDHNPRPWGQVWQQEWDQPNRVTYDWMLVQSHHRPYVNHRDSDQAHLDTIAFRGPEGCPVVEPQIQAWNARVKLLTHTSFTQSLKQSVPIYFP
jgi:hypothetical protein